jgi:hypothetical protein
VVPDLLFLRVPESKTLKNRLHIDLRPDDQQAEVRRLEALGREPPDPAQVAAAAVDDLVRSVAFQSMSSTGGPTKRWKSRSASAPTSRSTRRARRRCPSTSTSPGRRGGSCPGRTAARTARGSLGARADVAERPGEKARVEQVQDRVGDAADVLIDRHEVAAASRRRGSCRPRVAEAQEVPRRVDEGVHRVGLARRRAAADRAGRVRRKPASSAAATRRSAGTRRRRATAPAARSRAPRRCRRFGQ